MPWPREGAENSRVVVHDHVGWVHSQLERLIFEQRALVGDARVTVRGVELALAVVGEGLRAREACVLERWGSR